MAEILTWADGHAEYTDAYWSESHWKWVFVGVIRGTVFLLKGSWVEVTLSPDKDPDDGLNQHAIAIAMDGKQGTWVLSMEDYQSLRQHYGSGMTAVRVGNDTGMVYYHTADDLNDAH